MLKSPSSRARVIRSLLLSMTLSAALSACVAAPPVYLSASDCRGLVPDEWRKGVPSAPLPAGKTVGELAAFGDAQTGQLDIANERFAAADSIQSKCETLLTKAASAVQPDPFWKFW